MAKRTGEHKKGNGKKKEQRNLEVHTGRDKEKKTSNTRKRSVCTTVNREERSWVHRGRTKHMQPSWKKGVSRGFPGKDVPIRVQERRRALRKRVQNPEPKRRKKKGKKKKKEKGKEKEGKGKHS